MNRTQAAALMLSVLGCVIPVIGLAVASSPWTWILLVSGVAVGGAGLLVGRSTRWRSPSELTDRDAAASTTTAILREGLQLLAPVLTPHGFHASRVDAGLGSGGNFADASFRRSKRELHLSLRGSSLLVRYVVADREMTHAEYMRGLLGPAGGNAFPSYSSDPSDAFVALREDLEMHATDFVSGDGREFRRCWEATRMASQKSGFQRLGDAARDLGGR